MSILFVLKIIATLETAGTGLLALVKPSSAYGFTGLNAAGPLERVAMVHPHDSQGILSELRSMAAQLLPQGPTLSVDITPVIGVHIGPGAVGFAILQASSHQVIQGV